MNKSELHSSRLEELIGAITCEVVFQEGAYRKVHLRDQTSISKTLGLVYFNDFTDNSLLRAHQQIVKGSLLGMTLQMSGLGFSKVYLGSFELLLSEDLQHDFATREDRTLALYSQIVVKRSDSPDEEEIYADILEVVSPDIRNHFNEKAPPMIHINGSIEKLCKFGGVQPFKPSRNNK